MLHFRGVRTVLRRPGQHVPERCHQRFVLPGDPAQLGIATRRVLLHLQSRLAKHLAGRGLPQQQAQSVHIGSRAHIPGDDVLRRHVVERAQHKLAGPALSGLKSRAGNAEVQQLHTAARGHHHVGGLHVAVDDVHGLTRGGMQGGVGPMQRTGDRCAQLH